MTKKLVIGGLIAILVGALGIGIYSNMQGNNSLLAGRALAQGNGGEQGYRGGRGDDFVPPSYVNEEGQGNYGGYAEGSAPAGNGKGSWNRGYSGERAGNRDQGGYGNGTGIPDPQANVSEWLTLSGEIVSVDVSTLTLYTHDGQTLEVQLGPEWFWSGQGVSLAPGEQVTLQAFEENGQIQAGQISLDSNGATLALRDTDGQPLWAGGRGGGRR